MEPSASTIIWRFNGAPPLFSGTVVSRTPFRNSAISPFRVSIQIPPCGSGARLCPGGTCDARNTLAHPEIAYADKLSRTACTFRPNIPVDVLGHSNHHSKRLDDCGLGRRRNRPSLKRYSPSSTPTQRLPGAVFQHSVRLDHPEDHLPLRMDEIVPFSNVIKRPSICDPDRAISARQNASR